MLHNALKLVGFSLLGLGLGSTSALAQKAQKLISAPVQAEAAYGSAVATSNQFSFVGSPLEDLAGIDSGAVYQYDATTGKFIRKIASTTLQAGDHFGASLAARGKYLLVGAPNNDEANENAGAAYLFDTETGEQIAKFLPVEKDRAGSFGTSVALSDTNALVGMPASNEHGGNSGAAYLYSLASRDLTSILLAPDGQAGDRFGDAVALNSKYALIGSSYHMNKAGSAYLFDLNSFLVKQKFSDPEGGAGDRFGFDVALNETHALISSVSANKAAINAGSAALINLATSQIEARLLPTDIHIGQHFGKSVALSSQYALVGAFHDKAKGASSGAAYLYSLNNTGKAYKIVTGDLKAQDQLGFSAALSDKYALSGARYQNNGAQKSGGAYLITLP